MEPLTVRARLQGDVCLPWMPLALDALLGAAIATRDGLAPPASPQDVMPLALPLRRSSCDRYWLASFANYTVEQAGSKLMTKRPVIPEAQQLASRSTKRMDTGAGPNKGFLWRLPTLRLCDDTITWWCIGDQVEIRSLLDLIHYLGKKRSVGLGKVDSWDVQTCEAWGNDFPVALAGRPLRSLPADYPGLDNPELGYSVLDPPYWMPEKEELCAVPVVDGS